MNIRHAMDYLHKCTVDLEREIEKRNEIQAMLIDANQRVLRLKVIKQNAWGDLEMAKATAHATASESLI